MNDKKAQRLDFGFLSYLWQAGPLGQNKSENVPKFLSEASILRAFTENELRIFAKYLHLRKYSHQEKVFTQGDAGYGFYFVLSGAVSIIHTTTEGGETQEHQLAKLTRGQHFGEMGLMEEYNRRSAAAVSEGATVLLGLFKPDLEQMTTQHPVIGAKFMRVVCQILAGRVGVFIEELARHRHLGSKIDVGLG